MIHRIDKHILKQLLTHESQRFSELKPLGVESNTLTYRLKKMIKENLVEQDKNGHYYLTSQGRFYTDRLNLAKFTNRQLPKPILLLICRNQNGEWLLYERHIHPLKDLIGLPHANVNIGRTIVESAEKRAKEVIGIKTQFTYRGSGYLTIYKNDELECYNHIDILENDGTVNGALIETPESGMGRYFWQKDPDFSDPKYLKTLQIYQQLIDTKQYPFFKEITIEI